MLVSLQENKRKASVEYVWRPNNANAQDARKIEPKEKKVEKKS